MQHSHPIQLSTLRRLLASLLIPAALVAGLSAATARADEPVPPEAEAEATRVYIVQLRAPPAIDAAAGDRRVGQGRFDPRSPAVSGYGATLVASHDELLAEIDAPNAKLYSYKLAFNGFAAQLTVEQAARLRIHPAVQRVTADRARSLQTNASGQFLGLLDAGDGLRSARGLTGEDVVIGIIDSGIDPRHPSFADREERPRPRLCRGSWAEDSMLGAWLCHRFRKPRYRMSYTPPQDWHGRCEAGPYFPADACNNKLIGARFYARGFRQMYRMDPEEVLSPLDADGHGTHIASVAAGGQVKATIGDTTLAPISGMAPRARLAVYKACWLEPGATRARCAMSDLQRAIEDAIADGVDIINYSVGTGDGGPGDPDAMALLAAAQAGILAVAAAGNGGPAPASVESPATAPWVLAVAASSRAGTRYDEILRVTAPATAAGEFPLKEAAFTPALRDTGPVSGQLVTAADACTPLAGGSPLSGRIALVRRGSCDFQVKVGHAADAGAIAVVVYGNDDDDGAPITMTGRRASVTIPAVMISRNDGASFVARLAAGDALQITLQKGLVASRPDPGNIMYGQSARGPNANVFAILKPDVTAPGVNILGAQTPDVANGVRGERYQYLSGTSMAVPHVAGVAALLRQAHPGWSPAALRSALMTTARQDVVKDDGTTAADPFDFGAGHIVPDLAMNPGLIYDIDRNGYDAFGCGIGLPDADEEHCAALAAAGYSMAADDLNLPSITSHAVVHSRSIHRRVTNTGPADTYQVAVTAPAGITVAVEPATLTLAAGESTDYTVTFTSSGDARRVDYFSAAAMLPDFRFGSLTWGSAGHQVRSPLVVAPAALGVPAAVAGHAATGNTTIHVDFGYDGAYLLQLSGLAAPQSHTGMVIDDPLKLYTIQPDEAALPDFIRRHRINVPAGTRYLRVALDATDAGHDDDLDLYLHCPDASCPHNERVLASASEATPEVIDLLDPQPGEYLIDVHGYRVDDLAGDAGAHYEVGVWMVDDAPGPGGFSLLSTPVAATAGASAEITLGWTGLAPGELYLGLATHGDGEHDLAVTLVEIATPP